MGKERKGGQTTESDGGTSEEEEEVHRREGRKRRSGMCMAANRRPLLFSFPRVLYCSPRRKRTHGARRKRRSRADVRKTSTISKREEKEIRIERDQETAQRIHFTWKRQHAHSHARSSRIATGRRGEAKSPMSPLPTAQKKKSEIPEYRGSDEETTEGSNNGERSETRKGGGGEQRCLCLIWRSVILEK